MKRGRDSLKNKSGQVTIFIIIAIVIVAVVIGFFFISPRLGGGPETTSGFDENNPQGYIQDCLENDLRETIEIVSMQGGSVNPENYILYQNNPVSYLCYSSENYKPCVVQQALLKSHIETEISNEVSPIVDRCFESLKENYENKNYEVSLTSGGVNVELLPNRIILSSGSVFTATKSGETKRVDGFSLTEDNNLYELVGIANSIIEWESEYGDAETTLYTSIYSKFKVEKRPAQDESKIYLITDIDTKDEFQFAVRSQPLPSSFGTI